LKSNLILKQFTIWKLTASKTLTKSTNVANQVQYLEVDSFRIHSPSLTISGFCFIQPNSKVLKLTNAANHVQYLEVDSFQNTYQTNKRGQPSSVFESWQLPRHLPNQQTWPTKFSIWKLTASKNIHLVCQAAASASFDPTPRF
jgi:hypothetical protein